MINGYFVFVLATVVGAYVLDICGRMLNLRALSPTLPGAFSDVFDSEEYARSQRYTREVTRFEIVEDTFSLVVFLAFWWLGGFGWLDALVREWANHAIVQGILFVGVLYLASQIISLPFECYSTFVIEERFGFNKTSLATFLADLAKSLLLSALLGIPLLAVILFVFERFGPNAWFYGWVTVATFSLVITYVAPTLILPWFNKFTPLAEGELREAIQSLARQCAFPLTDVFEIDGSRRSTKSNAFFTGFGKNKKIALYDTLIQNHSVRELVAVLAHEIGHYKKKHIVQSLVLGILQMGILFFLLGLFLNNRGLFDAFGVAETSIFGSLVFFTLLFSPFQQLLSIGMMVLSRKNEYEADAYAAQATGHPEDLVTGLKRLSKDNLSNLTPHPFYVFLNYSHPPVLQRITALGAVALDPDRAPNRNSADAIIQEQ